MLEADALRMDPRHLGILLVLLRKHVAHADVWAYGSRVTGVGHEASDLDLALRDPRDLDKETNGRAALIEALGESDLPIRVDVVDWARIPASFRREIERTHVVVQHGTPG